MKYFILGALASGLLLYGMSMVYGATGTLEVGQVFQVLGQGAGNRIVLIFGLVFVVAGIGFKLGVCPSICGFPTFTTAHRPQLPC